MMDSRSESMAIAPRNHQMLKYFGISIACLVAVALQIIYLSPISSPGLINLPSPSSTLPSNAKLQEVIKIGEGFLKQPEDVAVDKNGVLYTATRDGWIRRIHENGSWENWWQIDSQSLLGLTTTAAGDLIVCDAEKGLLKVSEEGVVVLASHFNGTKIRFADDVIESSDGTLYFSVASTKYGLSEWQLDVLEARPYGQLLKYNPLSKETSLVLDDLAMANGVALSANQDFLIICESWKFRCLKYWLKGEKKGQTEIFIDNLPGGPDNINLAPDGSFWIALIELNPSRLRVAETFRASKYLIGTFPKLWKWVVCTRNSALVVNVGGDGSIIRSFDDPTGKIMSFVTSALEFENNLYLGSLHTEFVGKLPLEKST